MEVRRKDREITNVNEIKGLVEKCKVCRISFNYEDKIHIVPMNYGYEFDENGKLTFYMHSALDGEKISAIKADCENGLVLAVELDVLNGLITGENACDYGCLYESLVGNGKAFLLNDKAEKIYGLNLLMKHQTNKEFDYTDDMLSHVSVIKVDVESYTCKARKAEAAYAYVDGSFNVATNVYGYGGFVVFGGEKYVISGSGNDLEMASMRNVAGEVLGSTAAIKKAMELNIKKLKIYYDYNGIEKWATGEWKRNKKGTVAYHDFIMSVKDKIELEFEHVKGHSGIEGNEEADRLAKEACGIA